MGRRQAAYTRCEVQQGYCDSAQTIMADCFVRSFLISVQARLRTLMIVGCLWPPSLQLQSKMP